MIRIPLRVCWSTRLQFENKCYVLVMREREKERERCEMVEIIYRRLLALFSQV